MREKSTPPSWRVVKMDDGVETWRPGALSCSRAKDAMPSPKRMMTMGPPTRANIVIHIPKGKDGIIPTRSKNATSATQQQIVIHPVSPSATNASIAKGEKNATTPTRDRHRQLG